MLVASSFVAVDAAQDSAPQKRVLVLYALRQESPAYAIQERLYRQGLNDGMPRGVDYYSEYIDVARFDDLMFGASFAEFMARKYRGRQFDLVIANGPVEASFAGNYGTKLFPGVPIVFNGTSSRPVAHSTGFWYPFAMRGTIDLALRLQPNTKRIFLITGTSEYDEYYERAFRRQVPESPPGVELVELSGLSLEDLVARLATLPPDSAVMLISLALDGAGHRYVSAELVERLSAAANAPLYSWNGVAMGRGALGGRMLSVESVAQTTIGLALRVLRGERPETIPVTTVDVSTDQVDWRQLARWNISERQIPAGVAMQFREPSFFERYWAYVIAAIALISFQTGMIAGLLIQLKRRRGAERSLRESEERFRVMADTAPVMVWRSRADQRCDFFNRPWLEFRGRTLEEELGDGWVEGLHPEDRERFTTRYAEAFARREPFQMEYRLRRADGEYRWVLDTGVARPTSDGSFVGYIGSCIDITDRKIAEQSTRDNEAALRESHAEIQDLAGRLITAQEAERARIARELHDDISQQLAGIAIAISGTKRQPDARSSAGLQEALADLQERAIRLSEDLRSMSHDLHPGVLQHAGLVDALRSHCAEFARQHGIVTDVEIGTDPGFVELPIALCVYRVAQESLRNAAKHANAHRVLVVINRHQDEIHLMIADDGRGFDAGAVRQRTGGLGLRSIEERVRLAHGRVDIDTAPGRGTRVSVAVRVAGQTDAEAAGV